MQSHYHYSPDKCITCTICAAYCPVAKHTQKFHGPKMTGPAFERFRLLNQIEEDSLSYCANCKNCDIACPSGVPISALNMLARAEYYRKHRPPLRDWFVSHGEFLAKSLGFIPAVLRNFGMNNPVTRYLLDLIGIEKSIPLPEFTPKTFRQLYKTMDCGVNNTKKLVFFPGCYVNIYSPQIGVDLVEIFVKAGFNVIVPEEFICCGVPLISNGFANTAERNAVQNSGELARWGKEGVPVIAACPSCALMLKQEYKELFPNIENVGAYAHNVVDACEFISNLMDSGDWQPEFISNEIAAIYHAPCHLRAQGIGRTGLELVNRLPGVVAKDADAGCCGISGSYGFKKDKYKIAMSIGNELFQTINESSAPYILTECGTCQVQIKHGINKRKNKKILHPISLLRQRLK